MSNIPAFGYGEDVVIRYYVPGGKDEDGYPVEPSWAERPVSGVGIDVPQSVEPRDGLTQRADVDLVAFLPPGRRASSKDRIVVRGREYQVEGVAEQLPNFFTGDMFYTEVKLKRSDG